MTLVHVPYLEDDFVRDRDKGSLIVYIYVALWSNCDSPYEEVEWSHNQMRITFSDINDTNKDKVERVYLSQTMKNETEATLRKTIVQDDQPKAWNKNNDSRL